MKKENVINLIKYHIEKNEDKFRNESLLVAKYFDKIGDHQLCEYIMSLMAESNIFKPQSFEFEGDFLKKINIDKLQPLNLPIEIVDNIKGIINAVNHRVGINNFLFEGSPGTGKTEASKHLARLLGRDLYYVNFDKIIDSKLGSTNKNITKLFSEINLIPQPDSVVVLFDEIDVLAMDRVNSNDIREMGRATSTILREFDRLSDLNSNIVIVSTTNIYKNIDRALSRRFDAIVNFNKYSKEALIAVAESYFSFFIRNFGGLTKDIRLFRKIMSKSKKLPYPGELTNIIKTSLAFSDPQKEYDYLRRLYMGILGDLDRKSTYELYKEGFTIREIEKLTGESKSNVSRKIGKEWF